MPRCETRQYWNQSPRLQGNARLSGDRGPDGLDEIEPVRNLSACRSEWQDDRDEGRDHDRPKLRTLRDPHAQVEGKGTPAFLSA